MSTDPVAHPIDAFAMRVVKLSTTLGAMALAACAIHPPPPPPPVVREVVRVEEVRVPDISPADAAGRLLLSWNDELRGMSNEALTQEIARLGSSGTASVNDAMRLAVALGYSRNPGDIARALQLLDGIQQSPSATGAAFDWRPWAKWMSTRYQIDRRLEEQVDKQAQQLRDGQRRIDQLNQTVEALKDIERRLAPRAGSTTANTPSSNDEGRKR